MGILRILNFNFVDMDFFFLKGVTDHKTARKTIDSIMSKLQNEPFNQLIIVVEYGRADVEFYNNLEIMERCLNGIVDSSVMVIINKVPNKAKQRRIKAGENPLFDLKNEMNRLRDEIARVLKFQISAHFSLVDECNEFERMRNVINLSESFEFTNVKQWSDLVKIAQDSRVSREVQNELNESFRRDLNEKIEKITKNIHYMEYQIDWLDRGLSHVTKTQNILPSPMKYLIKPATYANEKKLTNLQTKKREEIERLREELARLVNIYESIERDNAALNEQINRYRDEITRLQRLLREE